LSIPLLPELSSTLRDSKLASVVQFIMRSSYAGYGTTSLDTDAKDVVHLMKELKLRGKTRVILCGHSTGTQDVVHLLRWLQSNQGSDLPLVSGAILLAPVSDREAFLIEITEEVLKERVAQSEAKVKEKIGHEITPRDWGYENLPCSYNRFLSLSKRLGQEDMWSSDLSEEEMRGIIGHVEVPTLVIFAGSDEYVPEFVDKKVLVRKLEDVMPGCCQSFIVGNAKHGFEDSESQQIVITHIVDFVKKNFK